MSVAVTLRRLQNAKPHRTLRYARRQYYRTAKYTAAAFHVNVGLLQHRCLHCSPWKSSIFPSFQSLENDYKETRQIKTFMSQFLKSLISFVWWIGLCITVPYQKYTGWTKKLAPFLYALTLPNINRFSKLVHCKNQEKICNNTITKDRFHHTSSMSLHYLVKYIINLLSIFKATIENETASVTTRFKKLTTGNNVFIVSVIV